jgi:hypothetical protein
MARALLSSSLSSDGRQETVNRTASFWTAQFADRNQLIIISAKRRLETTASNAARKSADAHPDGVGVVQTLFSFKNRHEATAEMEHYKNIRIAFRDISSGCDFDITLADDNTLKVMFQVPGAPWVDAANCGMGLQELLIILFFAVAGDAPMVAIEEPETHMHPEMQRRLLRFLHSNDRKQWFIATHSNVFLDNSFVARVLWTQLTEQKVTVRDVTSKASVLDDLGYSIADNLLTDLVILVEGPSDVPVFEELLEEMGVLKNHAIRFWPLGGDIMDQVDLSVLTQNTQTLAVVDSDPGSKKTRERFVARCAQFRVPVHTLKRYAIENYFSLDALRAVFPQQIPAAVKAIDPDISLEKQIGFSVKRQNRNLAKTTGLEGVRGSDLEKLLTDIRALVNG